MYMQKLLASILVIEEEILQNTTIRKYRTIRIRIIYSDRLSLVRSKNYHWCDFRQLHTSVSYFNIDVPTILIVKYMPPKWNKVKKLHTRQHIITLKRCLHPDLKIILLMFLLV